MLVCLLHTLESQLLPQPRRSTRQLAVQYSLRPRPSLSQTKADEHFAHGNRIMLPPGCCERAFSFSVAPRLCTGKKRCSHNNSRIFPHEHPLKMALVRRERHRKRLIARCRKAALEYVAVHRARNGTLLKGVVLHTNAVHLRAVLGNVHSHFGVERNTLFCPPPCAVKVVGR